MCNSFTLLSGNRNQIDQKWPCPPSANTGRGFLCGFVWNNNRFILADDSYMVVNLISSPFFLYLCVCQDSIIYWTPLNCADTHLPSANHYEKIPHYHTSATQYSERDPPLHTYHQIHNCKSLAPTVLTFSPTAGCRVPQKVSHPKCVNSERAISDDCSFCQKSCWMTL